MLWSYGNENPEVCTCMLSCFSRVDSVPHYGLQQARLLCSWGFPRQEYHSVLPCRAPGDIPNPGIKPMSPVAPALAGEFFTTEPPGKPKPND